MKPCSGEGTKGHRIQMLPAGSVKAEGSYRPIGYSSISYGSPLYSAAYSFKIAVDMLEGNKHPRLTRLPLPFARSDQMAVCNEGTWKEWKSTGCNVFPSDWVSPGCCRRHRPGRRARRLPRNAFRVVDARDNNQRAVLLIAASLAGSLQWDGPLVATVRAPIVRLRSLIDGSAPCYLRGTARVLPYGAVAAAARASEDGGSKDLTRIWIDRYSGTIKLIAPSWGFRSWPSRSRWLHMAPASCHSLISIHSWFWVPFSPYSVSAKGRL